MTNYRSDPAYSPKNILVTGGAGFIGSNVARFLVQKYPTSKIVVFDKLDYCASLRNVAEIKHHPNFRFIKGNIQEMDLVDLILQQERIDTVLHCAAQTHVDSSFGNSLSFTLNNTFGTHVLLESCRKWGKIERFIYVSTDEVYGETSVSSETGALEHSTLAPTNPYAAAKAAAEMLCNAYLRSYKLPIIVARSNNVYGPGQFPEKAVPKFMLLASQGKKLTVQGDGSATRSYIYVDDVSEAFDVLLCRGRIGDTYNIGTAHERSTLEVAKDVLHLFGLPENHYVHVHDRPMNDKRYFIGYSKLRALGWEVRTSWEDGLKKTKEWYVEHGLEGYWDNVLVKRAMNGAPAAPPLGAEDEIRRVLING